MFLGRFWDTYQTIQQKRQSSSDVGFGMVLGNQTYQHPLKNGCASGFKIQIALMFHVFLTRPRTIQEAVLDRAAFRLVYVPFSGNMSSSFPLSKIFT